MRTRRPVGFGRMPGIARTMSERARTGAHDKTGAQDRTGSQDRQAEIDTAEARAADLGLGLGGLFTTLRAAIEQLGQVGAGEGAGPGEGRSEAGGEKTFQIGGREGRMVFGYSMRTGLDGAAEPFGNVAEGGQAPRAGAPRQPIIDVYADGADIVVVAELPGVGEADVAVTVEGGTLLIAAAGWRKRVTLPGAVAPDSLRRTCRNGILEVRLARPEGNKP